ncbi:MAG: phage head morphogenesis protein [Clostridiales bacterium]|nr:phage head morphogenesis protein [Clostridiales bacterium]
MAQGFDELNIAISAEAQEKMRSLPYEQYFGEMNLTEEQKQRRIEMAEKFEDEILFILSLIAVLSEHSAVDWNYIQEQFKMAYLTVLGGESAIDDYTKNYITQISYDLTQTTKSNMGNEYNLSYDRARYISENEANTIINHDENEEAIAIGFTKKTWLTMRDRRVRHTHAVLEGKTIPIGNAFEVGDSLMNFPKDESFYPSDEEVVNCRCSIKYS